MTPEQFCYWLQGYVELTDWTRPDEAHWQSICDHLHAVFNKQTPDRNKIMIDLHKHLEQSKPDSARWPDIKPGDIVC